MAVSLLSSVWSGFGTSLQLSGPGGTVSGIPSLSSSSSHSSPCPSLSVSSWELLITNGQLSLVSWWPSPSLQGAERTRETHSTGREKEPEPGPQMPIRRERWCCYLSWFVSHESPTRSLSMSDWNKGKELTKSVTTWNLAFELKKKWLLL